MTFNPHSENNQFFTHISPNIKDIHTSMNYHNWLERTRKRSHDYAAHFLISMIFISESSSPNSFFFLGQGGFFSCVL